MKPKVLKTDRDYKSALTYVERLMEHAKSLGANAVLGVRFDSSDMGNGLAEILAYGTAVKVSPAS